MPATAIDRPGEKVCLEGIPAEPPKGMTREKAAQCFAELGQELFELQEQMFAAS